MSLLLEALKKAEKAKEEAQRRAQGERPEASVPAAPLEPGAGAEPEAVRTRNDLPDIRQPLEILSEEPAKPELSLSEEKPARAEPARPAPKPEAAQASERAAARKRSEERRVGKGRRGRGRGGDEEGHNAGGGRGEGRATSR